MKTHIDKIQNKKGQAVTNRANHKQRNPGFDIQMIDHRSVQMKDNNTGLPDNLKAGIENLSGFSMDDVKVHYSSDKPAHLNAHAYTQGTEIHVAPGQEKHLPHEAWHVVQQKQGRVKPTIQLKSGVMINDDKGLEKEADVMGRHSLNVTFSARGENKDMSSGGMENEVVQRYPNVLQIGSKTVFEDAQDWNLEKKKSWSNWWRAWRMKWSRGIQTCSR